SIDLEDYFLSDDGGNIEKWNFPKMYLQSNSHLIVFASGKNRVSTVSPLHTNFKIKASGEKLILSRNNKKVQEINAVNLLVNYSFGLYPDGGTDYFIFDQATPAQSNDTSHLDFSFIGFSHRGGIYDQSFDLNITTTDPKSVIRYTIDGSVPVDTSAIWNSSQFIDSSFLSDKNVSEILMSPVDVYHRPVGSLPKAVVIRAASFNSKNKINSEIKSQSYFIKSLVQYDLEIPVVSISANHRDLFNDTVGLFVPGIHYDQNNLNTSGNYYEGGPWWEREINVEYYEAGKKDKLNQRCAMRLHGSGSRKPPQKALRLYARGELGKDSFNIRLFDDKPFTGFKRLILKPYYASWSQAGITDYLSSMYASELNLDYLASKPVNLYINGEYWGIYFLHERIDERYLEQNHGVNGEDIDLIESWQGLISEGESDNWKALYKYIGDHSMSVDSSYARVQNWMDIDNFIDYQLVEMFVANYDWPGNNMKCWRERKQGAKWRWIFFDGDGAMQNYTIDGFDHAMDSIRTGWPTNPESTLFLRKLIKNPTFYSKFQKRFEELSNTTFRYSNTLPQLNAVVNRLEGSMMNQINRFGKPMSYAVYQENLDFLDLFLRERPCVMVSKAVEHFDLQYEVYDCLGVGFDKNWIKVYPNPVLSKFDLVWNSEYAGEGSLIISNLMGQQVVNEKVNLVTGSNRHRGDVTGLQEGMYIITIKNSQSVLSQKIVVRK
ncbi:MAG: CotH kinase family protein, partial [Bacteroidia bacterium]